MQRKRQNILDKTIALLLAMQLFLIGVQAKIRIDQGDSSVEALTWMIQQYIPVLVKIRSLQEKKEKKDSPKIKSKR
ncbi:hypothetical protein VF14_33805 [Nostoc linckia z18]|uniref:Uncharacterized protein n=2 Tax=Nostoc linckia TaxID=92942 RepID=A0A9Q5Z566_NOSLI|nr:hypothetical protein [Nostoc linckia]PHK31140.1 hypothetical protein VF12_28605 [Nostoc linckia z15]PHK40262.1 hypothetical protein VF13_33175 [Nostoc linckia z16]PHJ55068.1 hypothetical protein VF02_36270 [Nostoc linckia z1]PHJ56673.1 hypothetical protein VF05_36940 [Nostoc linckia z3]PHJ57215.1 hypothetical protein VF03_36790 [Nostoc linckia z2]